MNTRELIEGIAGRHNFDILQAGTGLLVQSIDGGEYGMLFLAPNYDEYRHSIKCVAKADDDNHIIRLTVYYDKAWNIKKAINDDTGLETDNLNLTEVQINELIQKFFVESNIATFMQEEK